MDVIDMAVFVAALGIVLGVAVVKLYEWRQDVLYGPYLKPFDETFCEGVARKNTAPSPW